jgi:hypothetical protein
MHFHTGGTGGTLNNFDKHFGVVMDSKTLMAKLGG